MRAISLWQPWATAMAVGSKRIETRHWPTKIRGTIAIHAAKRRNIEELIFIGSCWNWIGALKPIGAEFGKNFHITKALPFGSIVAVGDLVDCRPTDSFTQVELDTLRHPEGEDGHLYPWKERQMGNFDLGRFGWVFENVQRLKEPIPFKGMQGFFHVPDEILAEVEYA